jgi:polyphenol oxidase
VLVLPFPLAEGVDAWFTGRDPDRADPPVGRAGNLSHRRPHRPGDLARDRAAMATAMGIDAGRLHLMRQCHGAGVGVVDASTPPGAELDEVDALVTTELDRPLGVAVADCVPVLLAGGRTVAAAHAGRLGVATDVLGATVAAMRELGDAPEHLRVVVGPAIGGCCYEVPDAMRDELAADHPSAAATTTWGTPSLDLPAAVVARLAALGVAHVEQVRSCTRCDPEQRWFSHRADPDTGRQLGVVVRRASTTPPATDPVAARTGAA